jgi:hypothetical protein
MVGGAGDASDARCGRVDVVVTAEVVVVVFSDRTSRRLSGQPIRRTFTFNEADWEAGVT